MLLASLVFGPFACARSGPAARAPEERYRAILERAIDLGLPGFVLVVDRAGSEPWSGAAGYADLSAGRALHVDDPFHLASVTKAITAVAVLRLVARGELGLDDRIVEILDARTTRGLPAVERITVRHLLEHSSGLYSFNNDVEYWRPLIGADAFSGRAWTAEELLDFARGHEPAGAPGTGFYYADTNYVLLGEIVAALGGGPFKEIVRREVFEQLEMTSAYFYSDYRAGRADDRRPPVEGYLVLSEVMSGFGIHPDLPRVGGGMLQATDAHERSDTAAGVVASAPDMRKFARVLFGGGFLSPTAGELLREPARRVAAGDAETAGGILRAYAKPYGVVLTAEGDGPGGVHTLLAHHAASDSVIVAFTNVFGRFDESDFLLDEVVARIVQAP